MEKYLKELEKEIKKQGYDEKYTNICLNYARRLLSNNLPVIFDTHHLSLIIGLPQKHLLKMVFASERFYKEVSIPKKTGGVRTLSIPSLELKYIQRWILDNILKKIRVSSHATGFCDNKSILDNAKIHVGNECVLNMDIQNFFPTINFEKIFRIFYYYGYTKEISFILARLCTFKNSLPQGSPASPYLSNITCLRLDKRLATLAKKYQANYSRYADDITFSGKKGIKNIILITAEILADEGFSVNDKKTRVQYSYQRQEVTGLVVNNGLVRVNKHYKRRLYQTIYYCKKFGVTNHLKYIKSDKSFFKEHIYGKAYFVNMIEPSEGKKIFSLLDELVWDY